MDLRNNLRFDKVGGVGSAGHYRRFVFLRTALAIQYEADTADAQGNQGHECQAAKDESGKTWSRFAQTRAIRTVRVIQIISLRDWSRRGGQTSPGSNSGHAPQRCSFPTWNVRKTTAIVADASRVGKIFHNNNLLISEVPLVGFRRGTHIESSNLG